MVVGDYKLDFLKLNFSFGKFVSLKIVLHN